MKYLQQNRFHINTFTVRGKIYTEKNITNTIAVLIIGYCFVIIQHAHIFLIYLCFIVYLYSIKLIK